MRATLIGHERGLTNRQRCDIVRTENDMRGYEMTRKHVSWPNGSIDYVGMPAPPAATATRDGTAVREIPLAYVLTLPRRAERDILSPGSTEVVECPPQVATVYLVVDEGRPYIIMRQVGRVKSRETGDLGPGQAVWYDGLLSPCWDGENVANAFVFTAFLRRLRRYGYIVYPLPAGRAMLGRGTVGDALGETPEA